MEHPVLKIASTNLKNCNSALWLVLFQRQEEKQERHPQSFLSPPNSYAHAFSKLKQKQFVIWKVKKFEN